jgi:AraC-like DNA-binding protein
LGFIAVDFRIEVRGPKLQPRANLYGAGETRCASVPGPRNLKSCYAFASVGVVVSGRFHYCSALGSTTASPGTVLFGNALEEFSYRYHDTEGVRRSVIAIDGHLLAQVAESCGCEPTFVEAALAPSRNTARLYGAIRKLAAVEAPLEETIVDVAAAALHVGRRPRTPHASATEQRHVLEVARHLDRCYYEPIGLDAMARMAGLSRFHFIRVFRALTGENPRQYLIAARLRAAADRLIDTSEPILAVALNVGFNDLSHFNATFRHTFGVTPGDWRRRG